MTGEPAEAVGLRERVRRWVVGHAPCATSAVLAAVGRHIPAARAVAAGRLLLRQEANRKTGRRWKPGPHWTTARLAAHGRRRVVTDCLHSLCREGKLSRVCSATYGPPAAEKNPKEV